MKNKNCPNCNGLLLRSEDVDDMYECQDCESMIDIDAIL